jgi:hypothetical protein
MRLFHSVLLSLLFFPGRAAAQQSGGRQGSPCMPGMSMPGCAESADQQSEQQQPGGPMNMHPQNFIEEIQYHGSPGTSAEPNSTPTPMLMTIKGSWMLMFHANVFVLDQQQSSPRGGGKLFSTNWFMPMAQRKLGPGVLLAGPC